MKEKYDHRLLLKHLPADLRVFLEHIQVRNIFYFHSIFIWISKSSLFTMIQRHTYTLEWNILFRVWDTRINRITQCWQVCSNVA